MRWPRRRRGQPAHDVNRRSGRATRASRRAWAASLGKGVLVALLIRAFVAEAHVIPSESMTPALQVGDKIFADKLSYGLSVPFTELKLVDGVAPRPGHVVIFTHPKEGTRLVKRVVAVAGDTVALRDGQLVINGKPVPRRLLARSCASLAGTRGRQWLPDPCIAFEEQLGGQRYIVLDVPAGSGSAQRDFGPVVVPAAHVFVLGDNRPLSSDSRVWGAVPYTHLKGRARIIWWSHNEPDGLRWRRLGGI